MVLCGIQNIHMSGSLQDWERLVKKLASLKQWDIGHYLGTYINNLLPVLAEFLETYKGNPRV